MTFLLFVLAFLLVSVQCENNYTVATTWSSPHCTGSQIYYIAKILNEPCDPGQVSCDNQTSISTQCSIGPPTPPSSLTGISSWLNNQCTGDVQTIVGYGGQCAPIGNQSAVVSCSGDTVAIVSYETSKNCQGPSFSTSYTGCSAPLGSYATTFGTCNGGGGGGGGGGGSGGSCFHEDSIITYKGQVYKLADISKHPECIIPHHKTHDGVKISTVCPGTLRLTVEHLVETEAGYIKAGYLKVGDEIFQGDKACKITQVEAERNQNYFGLNCLESQVLANGYKTSTFGCFHTVPAIWMKYASKVIGLPAASSLGDSLATWASQLGLL